MELTQRRRILRILSALMGLLLATALCPTRSLATPPNPVPYIDSISPLSAAPGGAQFTLTVNVIGFATGATVNWNGAGLSTIVVSAQQLTATVPAGLIASSGTALITVTNLTPGGGTSNLVFLPVGASSAHVNFALFPYVAGTSALGVAQGDFKNRGKLDLITTNYGSNNLSYFLGNGDGTFQAPQTISLGSNVLPVGIVAADFNGDGNLDLAVGYDIGGPGVSILLGDGMGNFSAPTNFSAGSNTYEMVVGDFNGDGALDIAVTNHDGSDQIQVLLGDGAGNFPTAVAYPVSADPFYIQTADLNGDGVLDLVVAGRLSGTVSVLLGNSDGTFQPEATYTAGTSAGDIAIGDFDSDGIPDLIATGATSIYLLHGVGDGTFNTAQAIPVGFGTFVVAAGDFNEDGKLDLAVTKSSGGVGILLGNGDGTFQAAQSFPGASLTYGIVIGAFNNNGGLAVATTDFNANNLDVLLQTVSVSPASFDFGAQGIGVASAAQNFVITNSTSQLVNVAGISFTGTNAADFSEMDNCGSSLVSGAFCTVQVTFTPGAAGASTAALSVADDAPASPQTAAVTGTGTSAPVVGLSVTTLSFPSENVGVSSSAKLVTLTNNGNATLNITSIAVAGTNAADFSAPNNCGASVAPSALSR